MSTPHIPHLISTGNSKQLVVDGKPFLVLGSELQNSSFSSPEYMAAVWQSLVDANINTVLGSVTWEMIEPTEGEFRFEELDKLILAARDYGLRLVLLWFGSFKNGVSNYTPSWIKTNPKRFPRAQLKNASGGLAIGDVLSVFYPATREADMKAFSALMSHIKDIDQDYSTVIMVQVENEPGLLGASRDYSPTANKCFAGAVPQDLMALLSNEWDTLHEDLKEHLSHFATQSAGTVSKSWEDVFGQSLKTDEIFMAYHYARYVNEVAAAGKAVYPLPLFTNVWLDSDGNDAANDFPNIASGGGDPGDYPSGGATSGVLDIWQAFAPALDFVSPDIYLNDYDSVCAKYRHRNQPLFIPEQRRDDYGARRIWIALGSYAALGVSPFGIDTIDPAMNPLTKHYALLKSVSAIILDAQSRSLGSVGFCFDEIRDDRDVCSPIVRHFGGYEILIERCFVFGKPGTGSGMVIHRGGGVFLLIGWGFQVTTRALAPDAVFTGQLRFEEKVVVDQETGELRTARRLNGDETRGGICAMMPNADPDYGGFPVAITIPARTMIAELEIYHLTKDQIV